MGIILSSIKFSDAVLNLPILPMIVRDSSLVGRILFVTVKPTVPPISACFIFQ